MSISPNSLRANPSAKNQGPLSPETHVNNSHVNPHVTEPNEPNEQTSPSYSGNHQGNTWLFLVSLLEESNQYLVSTVFIAIGITILIYGPRLYKETAIVSAYALGCYLVISHFLEWVGHELTSLPGLVLTNIGGLCGVVFVYALSHIFVFTYLMGLSALFFAEILEAANILKEGISNNVITIISLLFGFLLSLLFMQLKTEMNIAIIFSSIGAFITAESILYFLKGGGDKWSNGICCVSNKFSKTGGIEVPNCHLLYIIWGLITCLGTIINLARVVTIEKIEVSSTREPLIKKNNMNSDECCSMVSSVKGTVNKIRNYILKIIPGNNINNEILNESISSGDYRIRQNDTNNQKTNLKI